MSDYFTRADWRRGKRRVRRKRKQDWGGRKVAPPAFLAAAKAHQFKPGYEGRRICKATKRNGEPCRRLALSDCVVCGAHGGWGLWARMGRLQTTGKSVLYRAERVAAQKARAEGPALRELARMTIYRQASASDRVRLLMAYQTPNWRKAVQAQLSKQQTTRPTDTEL